MDQAVPCGIQYVLNEFDPKAQTHFAHVIPLLEEIVRQGTPVRLVIEKAEEDPGCSGVEVRIAGRNGDPGLRRLLSLATIAAENFRDGYNVAFVRISLTGVIGTAMGRLLSRQPRVRAPIVLWQSGTTLTGEHLPFLRRSQAPRWAGRSLRKLLAWRLIDYLATGPEAMLAYYEQEGDVSPRRMLLLFNDVDCARYGRAVAVRRESKDRVCSEYGIDPDKIVILHNHRFSPVRRTANYFPSLLQELDSIGCLRRCHFLFVGGGPDRDSVSTAINTAGFGDICTFLGSVPNRELDQWYAASDIFLQASFAEGFPRVILEAMASELPIVTTDAGGTADLVGPQQARYVFSAADIKGMGHGLADLIANPHLREQLGSENRGWVARFDTVPVAEMYRRQLAGLLAGAPPFSPDSGVLDTSREDMRRNPINLPSNTRGSGAGPGVT
jgi:glycosyltransferase involved in cell wall biosynthesis